MFGTGIEKSCADASSLAKNAPIALDGKIGTGEVRI